MEPQKNLLIEQIKQLLDDGYEISFLRYERSRTQGYDQFEFTLLSPPKSKNVLTSKDLELDRE